MEVDHLNDPIYMHRRMRLHNIALMRRFRAKSNYHYIYILRLHTYGINWH